MSGEDLLMEKGTHDIVLLDMMLPGLVGLRLQNSSIIKVVLFLLLFTKSMLWMHLMWMPYTI